MSSHSIPVVEINEVLPHPSADRLEIIKVFGYTVCVGKGNFVPGMLATYVPPDFLVPVEREEFAFLKDRAKGKDFCRIRVMKMRGIISQGLLIPAPESINIEGGPAITVEGDNLMEYYGIRHYEPPIQNIGMSGDSVEAPNGYFPVYDVECGRRYNEVLEEGEEVVVTEKLDGANGRFAWRDGQMHCGSRKLWKKEDDNNAWWRALEIHPEVRKFCEEHPDIAVYGEIYGPVQKLKYGLREPHIAVFDLLRGNEWLSYDEAHKIGSDLPWVPFVMRAPFNMDLIERLAEHDSLVKTAPQGHIREGVVVKPIIERTHPAIGRVQLKIVSNRYLEKS